MAYWLPVYDLTHSSKAVIWLPMDRLGVAKTFATALRSSSVRSGEDIVMGEIVGRVSDDVIRMIVFPYNMMSLGYF
jgi:hypothetical protein